MTNQIEQDNEIKAIPKNVGLVLTLCTIVIVGLYWYATIKPIKVNIMESFKITNVYARYESCVTRGVIVRGDSSDLSGVVNRLSVYNPFAGERESISEYYLTDIVTKENTDIDNMLKDGTITQEGLFESCKNTLESAAQIKNTIW